MKFLKFRFTISRIKRLIILFMLIIFNSGCNGQPDTTEIQKNENNTFTMNRKAVYAGQFYPATKSELEQSLKDCFADALPNNSRNTAAIITPHAGYVFSGGVAASSYNQINRNKKYERVFIIASSHRAYFKGASIYYLGNYETPLGEVKVDMELAEKLIKDNDIFEYNINAHSQEHSDEVQLPFLQYIFGDDLKIVPIVLGTQSASDCKIIAKALKPYFNEKNLFVISTDFSHYPDYDSATEVDSLTANAIITGDPDKLIEVISSNSKKKISNLSTSLCGWTSVLTLMYMTEDDSDYHLKKIRYNNSGDSKYGDHSRVVGYHSIVVERDSTAKKETTFELTAEDKKNLLDIARNTIEKYVKDSKEYAIDTSKFSASLKLNCGAFVTLHKDGKLRGCIGVFEPAKPLYKVIQEMSVQSATRDSRFSPVSKDELDEIDIEISVLTPLKLISSVDEIELGKHGIYIKKGYRGGTFLPQVATETGWDKDEFLGHCSQDKAGLGWLGWKDADIYTYEAIIFKEE